MLIQSPRHTVADLALWDEYENADHDHPMRPGFFERLEGVTDAIGRFVEQRKPYYVCVSWGKDSLTLLHLFTRLRIECPVIYVRQLDNENPESFRVRDHYLARFPVPGYREVSYTYRDANPSWYKRGKPQRWYQVLRDLQAEYGCHVTGIRADESSKRRRRCQVFGEETINTFAPMSRLTCADVFAFLRLFNLPVHPNYAMLGAGRWPRERIRVAAIGNEEGAGIGRAEWEREYYGDVLRRIA